MVRKFIAALLLLVILFQAMIVSGWIFAPVGEAKYILVLGSAIEAEEPSAPLGERIKAAQEYMKAHPHTIAVLCGGTADGDNISEAEVIRRKLLEVGIDEGRLLVEDRSVNTWTNLKYALSLIENRDGEKPESIMVATSNYHVFRVGFLAKRLDVQVYPVIASTPISAVVHDFTREMFAIVKSFLLDRE